MQKKAAIIFILSALFYLYEFILQVAPTVMMGEITTHFKVGAVGFSTISAMYFYSYSFMQLPAGLMFDRYGPRIILFWAILACAIGNGLFGIADNIIIASIGRFLVGFGAAFSFIGLVMLIARWFPASKFALMVGIGQLLASVGAIFGEAPLAILNDLLGWRLCMIVLAIAGIILAYYVFKKVEDSPNPSHEKDIKHNELCGELAKFCQIAKDKQTIWVSLYAFCSWVPITVFAALWAVPYLQNVYGYSLVQAAHICSFLWIGVGVGSPIFGWISDRLQNRRGPLLFVMFLGLFSILVLMINQQHSTIVLIILFLLLGAAASGQALSFAVIGEYHAKEVVGTASGIVNFSVVVTGAILQPLFGYILNLNWQGKMAGSVPLYSAGAYNMALSMMPICFIIGIFAVLLGIVETAD